MGRKAAFAAIPIVGVNVVAFTGQLAYLHANLHWGVPGQILVAAVMESVAVYLAWQAHLAQLANDSALRLRLAAYGFAAFVGVLNYSHYAGPGWSPTVPAVVTAACSVISPWLWNIHSRRESRDVLMGRGLVEPHAVRLGGTRWFWHGYRSVRVMWSATWRGETDPGRAIGAVYPVPARVPAVRKESVRDIRARHGVSSATATKMRDYAAAQVRATQNGHGDG